MCNCDYPNICQCNNFGAKKEQKPHKHAEIIKAWADGAEIEFRFTDGRNVQHQWAPVRDTHPSWHESVSYRVKPAPHKWQKEMDAFERGETIQCRIKTSHYWTDYKKSRTTTYLGWFTDGHYEYRIKPEEVVRSIQVFYYGISARSSDPCGKANLKVTFEDGKLIKAEVISS